MVRNYAVDLTLIHVGQNSSTFKPPYDITPATQLDKEGKQDAGGGIDWCATTLLEELSRIPPDRRLLGECL